MNILDHLRIVLIPPCWGAGILNQNARDNLGTISPQKFAPKSKGDVDPYY